MSKKKRRNVPASAGQRRESVPTAVRERPENSVMPEVEQRESVADPEVESLEDIATPGVPLPRQEKSSSSSLEAGRQKSGSSSSGVRRQSAPASAAQRREKIREQRQRQNEKIYPTSSSARRRRQTQRSWWQRPWVLIAAIVVAVAVVVGIFVAIGNSNKTPVGIIGPSDPAIVNKVTHVSQSVLSTVGTADVQSTPIKPAPSTAQPLGGPTGKAEFFYYGAEYCPYCAGQRWAVVIALSRFGTFSQLPMTMSTDQDIYPNTSTFTFVDSKYTSQYIDFVPVEAQDRDQNPLQKLSASQQQILQQYNVTGYPFIDFANHYSITGPLFTPDVLAGLSQKDIANKLSDPNAPSTKAIVASANYITAVICATLGDQPAEVCTQDPIPNIERLLPQPAPTSPGGAPGAPGGLLGQPGALALESRQRGVSTSAR